MLVRAIALSLALLIGMATIIPFATDQAEAGPRKSRKKYRKHRKQKRYKKYSKRWWRQYHARQRRLKRLRARRRALRLRQLRLARKRAAARRNKARVAAVPKPKAQPPVPDNRAALLPSGLPAPASWKAGESTGAEVRFRVEDGRGGQLGMASISVVGPAMGNTVSVGRHRSLAGVPTTALRREVINRMIQENGWVINDYQKEVGGKTVYVVVAQSQNPGERVQSRMFYFTESEGRIYSVATKTATDAAEQLAEESEKVINSLQARPRPVQQAATKE